jgi:acyl carrier protein
MISEQLKKVLLAELELDDFPFTDQTLASEVPGWDSLSHIRVIAAVEKEFNVRLRALEVMRLKNVGELAVLIEKRAAR